MECDICSKSSQQAIDLLCVACARNAIYLPRLEHAQLLLDKDALNRRLEQRISEDVVDIKDATGDVKIGRENWKAHSEDIRTKETQKRIDAIIEDQEHIKTQVAELKQQIQTLKARIAEKKQTVGSVKQTLPTRQVSHVETIASANTKASASLARVQQKSAEDRAKLCREAASLMRLRQRRRQRDTPTRDQFSIAGLTLPDLREISNLRCADLSSVLGSVAHLTLRVAFYLGVRLPAEIIEPFADYPLHTILTPAASYKGIRPDSQNLQTSTSASTSSSASREESNTSLRPRPLSIGAGVREDRVFTFQKRDEQAFRYFVEGISLLAWNVAWLCRSQGFTAGTDSWEDVCNMGRNLHHMLVANLQTPTISRIQSERALPKRVSPSRKSSSPFSDGLRAVHGKLGQNSDLVAANHDNKTAMRDLLSLWEFASWHKIAIPLRKMLLAEIASTEWELLQDEEWDDGGEQFNEAVVVKSRPLDVRQYDDARNLASTRPRSDDDGTKGTSGWTKLKSRDKPA